MKILGRYACEESHYISYSIRISTWYGRSASALNSASEARGEWELKKVAHGALMMASGISVPPHEMISNFHLRLFNAAQEKLAVIVFVYPSIKTSL